MHRSQTSSSIESFDLTHEIPKPKRKNHFQKLNFFKNDLNNFGKDLIKEISCKMKNSSDNISYFKENIITQNINQSNLETNLNEKILSLSSIENQKEQDQIPSNLPCENEFSNNFNSSGSNQEFPNLSKHMSVNSEKSELFFNSFYSSKISVFLIRHDSTFRIIWDHLIFILILYSVIITPIYLCFFEDNKIFRFIEILIELHFIVDFILNFLTSFLDSDENTVTNVNLIVENYIFSWCFFDLLLICPFDLISCFYQDNYIIFNVSKSYVIKFTLFKWIKVIRLTKLLQTETIGKFLYQMVLNHNFTLNRVFKFVFLFFILSHITSCFFLFVGFTSINDFNWINYANLLNCYNFEMYIASLYYILVTIYTVGYGDILPINIWEKLTMIIFMLIGSMLYSYAISSLSTIFYERNTKYIEYKRKLSVLNSINENYEIPMPLYHKLKQTVKIQSEKNENEKFEFLESLPSNIRNDLTMVMYKSTIKKQKFFNNQPNNFLLYVLPLLKFHIVRKGDVLISVGEIIHEMYFVLKGCLSLNLGSQYDFFEISLIKQETHFGDLLLQSNDTCSYEIKCKSNFSDLLVLKKSDFFKIKIFFIQNILKIFENSLIDMEIINKKRKLVIELFKSLESSNNVKKRMKQLNTFLFQRDFREYFENGHEFEDTNDFIFHYDLESLKHLLNYLEDSKYLISKKEPKSYLPITSSENLSKNSGRRNNNIIKKKFKTKIQKPPAPLMKFLSFRRIKNNKLERKKLSTEIYNDINSSSFKSNTKKEDVFTKYFGILNEQINPLHNSNIELEKQYTSRITEIFKSPDPNNENNNLNKISFKNELNLNRNLSINSFNVNINSSNLQIKKLTESLREFTLENTVDFQIINNRQKENEKLSTNIKKENTVQNESFSLINNSFSLQSIFSKTVKNSNKKKISIFNEDINAINLNSMNSKENINEFQIKKRKVTEKNSYQNNENLNLFHKHLENENNLYINGNKTLFQEKNKNYIYDLNSVTFKDEKINCKKLDERLKNILRIIKKFSSDSIKKVKGNV